MVPVSVIVPAFKRIDQTIKTVGLLLGSEGNGSEFTLECIVADSSPDTSLRDSLISSFGKQVIYTQPSTPGIAMNKNQGAKLATHPILIFCDTDMEVEPDTIKKTVLVMEKSPTAAFIGGTVLWRGGPHGESPDRPRPEDRHEKRGTTQYTEAIYSRYVSTYKDIFWAIGGYDENVFAMRGEGSELSIRAWRAGFPLVFDPTIVVHHVYEVEDPAAVRVKHAQWAIAKDYMLLGAKYGFWEGESNFYKTVAATFLPFGENGYGEIIRGIAQHVETLKKVIPLLPDESTPEYPFHFLDVFTDTTNFEQCLKAAEAKIAPYRKNIFGGTS